ncbi:MAG: hypothetical protein FJ027_13385 [Candidatus Rokubacteria bacterium]|nr:hypothetical protein [Chloroflexota bacterium]MBM4441405.1 hypothetical protein [Candidatus Rokubacteria bacterium]
MRIALDFDGTIAGWGAAMDRWMRDQLGAELDPTRDVAEQMAREQLVAMVRAILGSELTLAMEPLPGALEAIARLSEAHALYVVTARNELEARFAREWLERHRVPLAGVLHTSSASKAPACDAIGADLLLDDTPAVLADLLPTPTRPVLLESRSRRAEPRPAGIHVVEHWAAFEALCARLSTMAEAR